MLTELQQKKLARMFSLYDTNEDGFVERADFEHIARNLAQANGLPPGSADYKKLFLEHMAIWDYIQRQSDANNDNRVTLKEFQAGFDRLLSNEGTFARLIGRFGGTNIAVADRDRDGRLTEQEFIANARAYHVTETAAAEAFRRFDPDGNGYITSEEMVRNIQEFFLSDHPQAVGNWLMGPF